MSILPSLSDANPRPARHRQEHEGTIAMPKNFMRTLTLLALLGVAPLLGACHTTAGVGEDISQGGKAIEHSAEKHAP
jgi:predicted small secreted protein